MTPPLVVVLPPQPPMQHPGRTDHTTHVTDDASTHGSRVGLYSSIFSARQHVERAICYSKSVRLRSANRLWSYGHFCISKMAVSRHLGFLKFERCTIRSADPENPSLEPNIMSMCCIQPEMLVLSIWKQWRPRHLVRGHPFQGHRLWCQSKAHMQLPISHQ